MPSKKKPEMVDDGLAPRHRKMLLDILTAHPRVQRVVLFGSRATGQWRPESDIDLAVFGESLDWRDLGKLILAIEETTVPWKVDLILGGEVAKEALRRHIEREGIVWFDRNARPTTDQS